MSQKMDEFKIFVSKYPLLRDEVRNNKMTWQNIFEEWSLYGENDEYWKKYKKEEDIQLDSSSAKDSTVNLDSIKSIVNYVQKINPDSLNKTLNTVQKVIQIAQTFSGSKVPTIPQATSLYSDWWD